MRRFTPGEFRRLPIAMSGEVLDEPYLNKHLAQQQDFDLVHGMKVYYLIAHREEEHHLKIKIETGEIYRKEKVKW